MGIKADEESEIDTWTRILADSHGRLNLASHSYYHDYMGLSDDESQMNGPGLTVYSRMNVSSHL